MNKFYSVCVSFVDGGLFADGAATAEEIAASLRNREVKSITVLDACPEAIAEREGTDEPELLPGEDMDGDHQSALASIGWGTDEDYHFTDVDEFESDLLDQ